MECKYPYNCVTAKSLEDERVCERFEKLLRNVFEDGLPISFEIIKRCVKEREVRAAMIRDDFLQGKQRIVGTSGGQDHEKHYAFIKERMTQALTSFKEAQEQGDANRRKYQKYSVLYCMRDALSCGHLPSVTIGVKDNMILCGYAFLPYYEKTDHENTV